MLELSVNSRSAASITAALKKIRDMIMTGAVKKDTPVHIILESGVYKETVRYNLTNPLIMESIPGTDRKNCVIQADNCESFHKGIENRCVFTIGPSATNVTLKNFTIANTHNKISPEGTPIADAAEAFVWNNTSGTLLAENMAFEGRQGTLFAKGFTWFKDCKISGNLDFIYGEPDTSLFESCEIHTRDDDSGDFNSYAVKSLAMAGKSGFVFLNCRFTGEKRKKASLYVFRTAGLGNASSLKNWDSAALINCFVSEVYDPELGWDDDMDLTVYPRGNAKTGWREYNTKIVLKNGKVEEADTSRRNIKSYLMTDDDYFKNYASRYLILHDTPFALVNQ